MLGICIGIISVTNYILQDRSKDALKDQFVTDYKIIVVGNNKWFSEKLLIGQESLLNPFSF